jgi:hypothetical protein
MHGMIPCGTSFYLIGLCGITNRQIMLNMVRRWGWTVVVRFAMHVRKDMLL